MLRIMTDDVLDNITQGWGEEAKTVCFGRSLWLFSVKGKSTTENIKRIKPLYSLPIHMSDSIPHWVIHI